MPTLLASVLPFAGCAAMMVVCSRMMRRGNCAPGANTEADATEVAQLRAEVAELRCRLTETAQRDPDQIPVR